MRSKVQLLCRGILAGVFIYIFAPSAHTAVIWDNNGLEGAARWDAAPRLFGGVFERSLDGGLRYSMEGGSYEAYRDLFTWNVVPSVSDFQLAVENAFASWTVTDPNTGLGTQLSFSYDPNTIVVGSLLGPNAAGAEIDLLAGDISGYRHWQATLPGDEVTLTSGTTGYQSSAIIGMDIHMGTQGTWTLDSFQAWLTQAVGRCIGLGGVLPGSNVGPFSAFMDDNFDGTTSTTAFETLTNPWSHLVDPLDPAASPLSFFDVPAGDPGFGTPGVNMLMEAPFGPKNLDGTYPLSNDEFGGRQFLYPQTTSPPNDADGDGVPDTDDNCILVPNGTTIPDAGGNSQLDSNGDGYGNICDADLNDDLVVNGLDVGPFVEQFGTSGPDADLNGDGVVNGLDVGPFVGMFGQAPGPSGQAP
jgi:hypothetical protein